MAANNQERWHFLYWDDFEDYQEEGRNEKKSTFDEDEQEDT